MVTEVWDSVDDPLNINVQFTYTGTVVWRMNYVKLPFWSMRKQPGAKDFLGFYFRRFQIHIEGRYENGFTASPNHQDVSAKWQELSEYYNHTFNGKRGVGLFFDAERTTFRFECARRSDALLIKMQLG